MARSKTGDSSFECCLLWRAPTYAVCGGVKIARALTRETFRCSSALTTIPIRTRTGLKKYLFKFQEVYWGLAGRLKRCCRVVGSIKNATFDGFNNRSPGNGPQCSNSLADLAILQQEFVDCRSTQSIATSIMGSSPSKQNFHNNACTVTETLTCRAKEKEAVFLSRLRWHL